MSPDVVGRLVRKITSQRRSAARPASFLTMPGSVSSSDSQKPSIERTWRQSARRSRSLSSSSCCSGALSATSEGTMSAMDEASWEGRRPWSRWGRAPNSFSASRTSAPSMSASTPSRSHPIRSAIRQPWSFFSWAVWKRSRSLRLIFRVSESGRANAVPRRFGGSGTLVRSVELARRRQARRSSIPRHWHARQRYGRLPVMSRRHRSHRLRVCDRRRSFELHLGQ